MHIFWCWLFVDILEYDIEGIGLACTITNMTIFILMHIYIMSLPEIKNRPLD